MMQGKRITKFGRAYLYEKTEPVLSLPSRQWSRNASMLSYRLLIGTSGAQLPWPRLDKEAVQGALSRVISSAA